MDYGNTKTPSLHHTSGSATLLQLAFPRESYLNFSWGKSQWDDSYIYKKSLIQDNRHSHPPEFISVQEGIYVVRKAHNSPPYVSNFLQCCLWNHPRHVGRGWHPEFGFNPSTSPSWVLTSWLLNHSANSQIDLFDSRAELWLWWIVQEAFSLTITSSCSASVLAHGLTLFFGEKTGLNA